MRVICRLISVPYCSSGDPEDAINELIIKAEESCRVVHVDASLYKRGEGDELPGDDIYLVVLSTTSGPAERRDA